MKMKKALRVVSVVILAIAMSLSCLVLPQPTQAATSKTTVTISSPVKVSSGKTGQYTLYQINGKKASFTIKAKAGSGTLKYKSSNTNILAVSQKGVVQSNGKKTGTAVITVYSAKDSKVNAKIKVSVKNFAPKLNASEFTIQQNQSKTLKVSGAGVKSVAYKSSNTKVATVNKSGKVTGVAAGKAKITATVTSTSGVKTNLTAIVTAKGFAPKLNVDTLELQQNQSKTLKVSVANLKSVTFKSSNTAVATVSSKGKVTAVGAGTAKIVATVTSTYGAVKKLSCTVTVEDEPVTKDTIDYAKVYFDYKDQIAAEKAAIALVPEAAAIDLVAEDANGATGVVLVNSLKAEDTENFYLNAYVAVSALKLAGKGEVTVKAAESSIAGALAVTDGTVSYVLPKIDAAEPVDEILTVTMSNDKVYKIHTLPQAIPAMEITGEGVAAEDEGIYTFTADKFLLRVDTNGKLIYYRDMNCTGELMAEGFAPQVVNGRNYYTVFVELHRDFRNANGGYSSGMYLMMDENYRDIDQLTLLPNEDPNHTHGEGYLDQHELVMLGEGHYLLLSYTLHLVNNLPKSVAGIDGTRSGYVWAGIMQEVKDGKVIAEINTADYPLLYESAVEKLDYAHSTLDGVDVTIGQVTVHSFADGIMDYVHVNSLDYTLDADGTVDKLLVSMRDQSAVYQFDMDTAAIDWILGGKASTLGGYEAYTTDRTDDNGAAFKALTFGQHYARYTNRQADGTIAGNAEISVFDNQTGMNPFLMKLPVPTVTRTFKAVIDETAGTAALTDVIVGADLNGNGKYHNASHCGSVQYDSATSVTIGWGLHGVIDNLGPYVPAGTMSDIGFDDLRQGSRPIFTDYNPATGKIGFELSVTRSPLEQTSEALFSYRTYKTAE